MILYLRGFSNRILISFSSLFRLISHRCPSTCRLFTVESARYPLRVAANEISSGQSLLPQLMH